jgi:sugar (pentulose or hexulose) kinase
MSDIDSVADELDLRARQVESVGAHLVRAAAEALWTSIAADAFRARVEKRHGECVTTAAMLRAAARAALSLSDDVAAEQARLRRIALTAEHVVLGAVDDASRALQQGLLGW